MFLLPSSAFYQAEIIQIDRWEHGPLELVFLDNFPKRGSDRVKTLGTITET